MNAEDDKCSPPEIYIFPMCQGDRWIGLGRATLDEVIVPAPIVLTELDEQGNASGPQHCVLAIACTCCGFVRLHSPDALGK